METIIYNRTSTTEQNPENQLKDCHSINSFGEALIFSEQQSAWKDNLGKRDQFLKLLSLIKQNKVRHLIVWDVDRIYRNRKKLVEFFSYCKHYGCNIHSFRQRYFEEIQKAPAPWNEIMFDLIIQIYGHIAQDESDRKSQRIKAAVRIHDGTTISYKGRKWGRKSIISKVMPDVIKLKESGLNVREIAKSVFYYDHNNNKRNISIGLVHKILKQIMNTAI